MFYEREICEFDWRVSQEGVWIYRLGSLGSGSGSGSD